MAVRKYRFAERVHDPSTGESSLSVESPKLIKTREFGERLLHRIVKVRQKVKESGGRKYLADEVVEFGGWVESEMNLSHEGECWIGSEAVVCGGAVVSGNARVDGKAEVGEGAKIAEDATVGGSCIVSGNSYVFGKGSISGESMTSGNSRINGKVFGKAMVSGSATIQEGASVSGNAKVGGRAIVKGQISGEAIVTDMAFVGGKVGGRAIVIGSPVILESSVVEGEAFIDGGTIKGNVNGKARVGSWFAAEDRETLDRGAYRYYQETSNLLLRSKVGDDEALAERLWEGVRWCIEKVWDADNGTRAILGESTVYYSYDNPDVKELADRKGWKPDKNDLIRIMTVGNREFSCDDVDEKDLWFIDAYADIIPMLSGPYPIIEEGTVQGESRMVGGGYLAGTVKGRNSVSGNVRIDGTIEGKNILVGGNSSVSGMAKGEDAQIADSIVGGVVEGMDNSFVYGNVASVLERSVVGRNGSIKGKFLISDSVIDGKVTATEAYQLGRGERTSRISGSGAIVGNGEMFTVIGVPQEYKAEAAANSLRIDRIHSRDYYVESLSKRLNVEYWKKRKQKEDREAAEKKAEAEAKAKKASGS